MPLARIQLIASRHAKIIKRVRHTLPFFCALLFCSYAQARCVTDSYDETIQVKSVHDGDTLRLIDGRKLRLIGINTPELARYGQPAEPYAKNATRVLRQLVKSQDIKLRYGIEKQDRYGRLLAHVFLTNGQNITEQMLKKGMGMALVVPPNLWSNNCYQQAERQAQQKNNGLWQHPRYQAIAVNQLSLQLTGYYRVKGRIKQIEESRSAYWLKLGEQFAIKIKKSDDLHFNSLPIYTLKNKIITARGWIYKSQYKNKAVLRMRIRHPAALDIVE